MATRKILSRGNPGVLNAVADPSGGSIDIDREIRRGAEELSSRPVRAHPGNVLAKLAMFSDDFMAEGRRGDEEVERDAL